MCAWAGLLCKLDMDLEVITAALWTLLIREEDWSICLCTDFGSAPSMRVISRHQRGNG